MVKLFFTGTLKSMIFYTTSDKHAYRIQVGRCLSRLTWIAVLHNPGGSMSKRNPPTPFDSCAV